MKNIAILLISLSLSFAHFGEALSQCSTPSTPTLAYVTNEVGCTMELLSEILPLPGITWYWQDSEFGTSTSHNAISAFEIPASGTYFLRARANCGLWSLASASTGHITITSLPAVPGVTVSGNTCGTRTIYKSGSPDPGIAWYWQGTNQFGTDTSSPTATAATFTIANTGTATYYLGAYKASTGCWSHQGIQVTVDNPAPPANNSFVFCEWDNMQLQTTGVSANLKWYDNASSYLYTGLSYSPYNLSIGNHTFQTKNISAGGCESTSAGLVTVTVEGCDNKLNWTESKTFGLNGEISSSRTYRDGFGSPLQSQHKLYSTNQVMAAQGVYDASAAMSLATLPAPINSSSFVYKYRFASANTNEPYHAKDFDTPAKLDNPTPMSSTGGFGTLGWYYSTNNTVEPLTPATSYPYARSWVQPGPDPVLTRSAGAGDNYRMGSNNESRSERQSFNTSELSHYYALKPYFLMSPNGAPSPGSQVMPTSATMYTVGNHREIVSQSGSGMPGAYLINGPLKVIPGKSYSFAVKGYKSSSYDARIFISDVNGNIVLLGDRIPEGGSGSENWVTLDFVPPPNVTTIKVGIAWTQPSFDDFIYVSAVSLKASPLPASGLASSAGYKYITTDPDEKRSVSFVDNGGRTIATAVVTSVSPLTYDYWSYAYYNDIGQLVASIAPNGVVIGNTSFPEFITTYEYDYLGRLIKTTSPDEGTSRYVYSTDGKIRFSQSQQQHDSSPQKFSYTNYDEYGRLIESGEFTASSGYVFETHDVLSPAGNSVLNIVDYTGFTGITHKNDPGNQCSDYSYIYYDTQAQDFPNDGNHSSQSNLLGQVAKTENANASTWYSYDEFGQVSFTIQSVNGLGNKTVDYVYDYLGNVTKVIYQIGNAGELFYHHYVYDEDQRLKEVYTNKSGTFAQGGSDLRAKYFYYLHGPLKRIELGGNIQGIDYVHGLDGLKSINNADAAKDPGRDGMSGPNVSKAADVFGMTLHYNASDFTAASTDIGTFGFGGQDGAFPGSYSGNLRGITYHSPVDANVKRAFGFQYDAVNQLTNAQWGTFSGSGTYNGSLGENYRERIPANYDKNGNILSLERRNGSGTVVDNFFYNYESGTNKLDRITQGSSGGTTLIDYTYNAIGQMIQQTEGSKTMKVSYNAYGLVKDIRDGSNVLTQSYMYDDRGDLVKKTQYNHSGTAAKHTFYSRDLSGTVMAIFEQAVVENATPILIELPVYGAGRVATYKPGLPAYLYEVTDHLGNVRAVINAPETITVTATMETANRDHEQYQFLRYDNVRKVNSTLFNHTTAGGSSMSMRLSGVADEKIGLARSLYVSPGDVVDLKVFAKYADTNQGNWTAALTNLIASVQASAAGIVIDGAAYPMNSELPLPPDVLDKAPTTAPKAYLNYLFYNSNFDFQLSKSGYVGITEAAKETGSGTNHEELSAHLNITEPGYLYVYLSNENLTPVEVYFDDFQVTHTQSSVVSGADYYPFGLAMEGREIKDEPYRYGYQGQFSEKDVTTGMQEFQLRMYDARIGRWLMPDPYGQFMNPYIGMGNSPLNNVDPDGGWMMPPSVFLGMMETIEAIYATVLPTVTVVSGGEGPIGLAGRVGPIGINLKMSLTGGTRALEGITDDYVAPEKERTDYGFTYRKELYQAEGYAMRASNSIPSSVQSSPLASNKWIGTAGGATSAAELGVGITLGQIANRPYWAPAMFGVKILSNSLAVAGVLIGGWQVYDDVVTGRFDAHTVVGAAVSVTLAVGGAAAATIGSAPLAVGLTVAGLGYGLWSTAGGNDWINRQWHQNIKPLPRKIQLQIRNFHRNHRFYY